jgi:transposase-like protein
MELAAMSFAELQNPIFTDENAAREALEACRWPNGPVCPHCGSVERNVLIGGEKHSHRPGLYYCNGCKGQFTVTVGSVFERSKVPLTKWWLATFMLGSSKKGMSTHQLHRMLGVTYKTAWFMTMRIREAMREGHFEPLGGEGKFVESDETFTGGKAKNRAYKAPPPKEPVLALVERGGKVRSYHIPEVTATTLKPIIVDAIAKDTHLGQTRAASIGRSARNSPAIRRSFTQSANTSVATRTQILSRVTSRSSSAASMASITM